MDGEASPQEAGDTRAARAARVPRSRRVAIGCFTAFLGCLSGGMVAVLISMFIAYLTRATSCPGIPTCNWYAYWGVGAVVGGTTLPWLVVRALGKPKRST